MAEPKKSRTMTISVKQDITALVEQYGKYAWILHDKDVLPDTGELKDPHYHIFLEFPNARSLNSVASELDVPPNMVQIVRDKKGILKYFTHQNSPEKYQYDVSEIHCNFDIESATASLDMMSVLKLLDGAGDMPEFIAGLVKRGMTGNPVTNLVNCFKLWNIRKGSNTNDIT